MKKISQAIIGATLILDVAVVFTFGLAIISSFEDGSRLPETTFVRKASEGRVAGVTTSTCPTTANVFIETPIAGSVITSETFRISAMAGTSVPASALMNFVYPITVSPFYKRIPAVYQSYTTPNGATYNKWIADVNVTIEQIPKGLFTFHAESYDTASNCIAKSVDRAIDINYIAPPMPVVSIILSDPGAALSGAQATIIGEITNLPAGTQIQEALIKIFNNGAQIAGPFDAPALNANNYLTRQSIFNSTALNGVYDVKMFVHYAGTDGIFKSIESAPVSVTVSNASATGGGTITVPLVALNNPSAGTLSGTKGISGTLSNFPTSYSLSTKVLQAWQGATWKKDFFLTRDANNLIGNMDTTMLPDGEYTFKIHLVYNDGTSDKVIDSSSANITVNNANTSGSGSTSTDTSSTSGTSTSGTSSTTDNTSTGTSGSTGSTSTDNTSASGTGTSGSTGTTTPPPTSATTTTSVSIISPAPLTILRSRDNRLEAKTSVAASGLQFKIHKAGEPVIQNIPVNADYSDGINWKANMSLMIFNDGEYDITAVVGDIKSASLNVVVQKFAFNWLTPLPSQTPPVLSGNVPIKAKIGGIYEKDGTTPVKGVKAYFYQAKTTAPYTEIYNEQLYQIPGSQEWRLYDWTLKREKLWKTAASPNGKFHLIIKVINESISATEIWSPAEKILIEINNQQTVASSINTNASAVGTNNNQNLNTAATNTTATNAAASNSSNITVVGNTNAVNNTNSDSAQNANTANDSAAAAAQIDSDQDLLSDEDERARGTDPNLADTDNDGLTDFVEIDKYKTDPLKNDTDGDGYLDGEEAQSLHDPLKPPTDPTAAILLKPKPAEEPKSVEKPILESLVVERIENKPLPLPDNTNNPEPPPDENIIILKGKGPANTILTLFIYSVDPLVITVKTDDDGNWEYELDKKLEDGEHELYVTVTDDTGKIQSQSNPIAFFVKEAKAVSPENYRADLAAREPVKTSSTDIYLIASGVLVLIAAIAGLAVALRRKSVI